MNLIVNSDKPVTINTPQEDSKQQTVACSFCASHEIRNSLFEKTVTLSFDYNCEMTKGVIGLAVEAAWQPLYQFKPANNGVGRMVITVQLGPIRKDTENAQILYLQEGDDFNSVGTVTLSNIKLELGAVAEPIWTPAPEDITAQFAALDKRIKVLEGKE